MPEVVRKVVSCQSRNGTGTVKAVQYRAVAKLLQNYCFQEDRCFAEPTLRKCDNDVDEKRAIARVLAATLQRKVSVLRETSQRR